MSKNLVILAALVPVMLSGAAFAQSVTEIKGNVRVNTGTGFVQARVTRSLAVGDRVMAQPNGSAVIQYPNGCRVPVAPGEIVTVLASPPCVAGGPPISDTPDLGGFNPAYALVGGIVVVGGVLLLVNSGSDDKPTSP